MEGGLKSYSRLRRVLRFVKHHEFPSRGFRMRRNARQFGTNGQIHCAKVAHMVPSFAILRKVTCTTQKPGHLSKKSSIARDLKIFSKTRLWLFLLFSPFSPLYLFTTLLQCLRVLFTAVHSPDAFCHRVSSRLLTWMSPSPRRMLLTRRLSHWASSQLLLVQRATS